MAGIDKTYINGNEYIKYRNWYIENYDKMIKEMGDAIWFYPFGYIEKWYDIEDITPQFLSENMDDVKLASSMKDFPIWNTSEKWDKWLLINCPIKSFQDRMKEVYSSDWVGFENTNIQLRRNWREHLKRKGK